MQRRSKVEGGESVMKGRAGGKSSGVSLTKQRAHNDSDDRSNDELPDGPCTNVPTWLRSNVQHLRPAIRVAKFVCSFPVKSADHNARIEIVQKRLQSLQGHDDSVELKTVNIYISIDGIKVESASSPEVFMFHSIRRISYAACNPENRQFSFLARPPQTPGSLQFCHVFLVQTSLQAEELQCLVGNSFKLAFAQQIKSFPSPSESQSPSKSYRIIADNHAKSNAPTPFHGDAILTSQSSICDKPSGSVSGPLLSVVDAQSAGNTMQPLLTRVEDGAQALFVKPNYHSQQGNSRANSDCSVLSKASKLVNAATNTTNSLLINTAKERTPTTPIQVPVESAQAITGLPRCDAAPVSASLNTVFLISLPTSQALIHQEIHSDSLTNFDPPVESAADTNRAGNIAMSQGRLSTSVSSLSVISSSSASSSITAESSFSLCSTCTRSCSCDLADVSGARRTLTGDATTLDKPKTSDAQISSKQQSNLQNTHKPKDRNDADKTEENIPIKNQTTSAKTKNNRALETANLKKFSTRSNSFDQTPSDSKHNKQREKLVTDQATYTKKKVVSNNLQNTTIADEKRTVASTGTAISQPKMHQVIAVGFKSNESTESNHSKVAKHSAKFGRSSKSTTAFGTDAVLSTNQDTSKIIKNSNSMMDASQSASSNCASSKGQTSTIAGHFAEENRQVNTTATDDFDDLQHYLWFKGNLARESVPKLLVDKDVGSFIVRCSTTHRGAYALSVRVPANFNPEGLSHFLILRSENKFYRLKGLSKRWTSIPALVSHLCVYPETLPCLLKLEPLLLGAENSLFYERGTSTRQAHDNERLYLSSVLSASSHSEASRHTLSPEIEFSSVSQNRQLEKSKKNNYQTQITSDSANGIKIAENDTDYERVVLFAAIMSNIGVGVS